MKRALPLAIALVASGAAGKATPRPAEASGDDEADQTRGQEGEDPGAEALERDDPAAPGRAATLAAEAARILWSARETTYQHRTVVDEEHGRFDVDCSGFVGYLLRRVAPAARAELAAATVKRPLAKHFTAFIDGLPAKGTARWQRVADAHDLRAGDIVAWVRPADSKSTNTGHVMVVAGPPTALGADLTVPIFDSTATHHGAMDRRAARSATGVGRGSIVLRVDAGGRPVEFRWSPTGKYRYHATAIALGRVKP